MATQNTLVLNLSEDAYLGNAQFTVSIDGHQLGAAQSVTTLHSSGASEAFTFAGTWGPGPLTINVSFINDAWGGSASLDRNLYVNSISYDGTTVPNASATMYTDSTVSFSVAKPTPSPAGTLLTSTSGSLVDRSGNTWTLVQSSNGKGLQIACNGTVDPVTNHVILLESLNGSIVQENSSGNWYSEPGPGGPWTQISAPSSNPGSSGSASSGSGTDASTYLETHRFFADSSPWNTPISPNATYTPVPGISSYSDGLVSWIPGGGTTAIYYAQPSDPTVEVLYNPNTWSNLNNGTWSATGNSASTEQQIISSSQAIDPLPVNPYSTQVNGGDWRSVSGVDTWNQTSPLYIHVPAGAVPSGNSDGQTVIIQPDGTAVELYAPIKLSNGDWVSEMFSTTNALSSQGTGVDNGRRASETPNYSGTIRDTDIQQGQIDHALAIVVPQSMLAAAYTGVAMAFDSGNNGYSGSLPMGSLLALPASTNINSLGLETDLGKEIAQAAATYGMYIVDRGGSGISISVQANPTTPALANWSAGAQHDLDTIVHMLQVVTHN